MLVLWRVWQVWWDNGGGGFPSAPGCGDVAEKVADLLHVVSRERETAEGICEGEESAGGMEMSRVLLLTLHKCHTRDTAAPLPPLAGAERVQEAEVSKGTTGGSKLRLGAK